MKQIKMSPLVIPGLDRIDVPNTLTPKPVDYVVKIVCDHYKLSLEEIKRGGSMHAPRKRQVLMYFLTQYTDMSLNDIGRFLKRKKPFHHSTVIHARDKVLALTSSDPEFAKEIRTLRNNIYDTLLIPSKI